MKVSISKIKEKVYININNNYKSVKSYINKSISLNENIINKILYFITSRITILTINYKKFRKYSV